MTRLHEILMETAKIWANASRCSRNKVGAIIARDGRIIATGYNGTPPGFDNCCEDCDGNTKEEVIHAEQNAILFCARNGLSTLGTTLYVTLSPCPSCAKMIAAAGIEKVFYLDEYRNPGGIDMLIRLGVNTRSIKDETSSI